MDKQEIEEILRRTIDLVPVILYAISAGVDAVARSKGDLPPDTSRVGRLFLVFSSLLLIELCKLRWAIQQAILTG